MVFWPVPDPPDLYDESQLIKPNFTQYLNQSPALTFHFAHRPLCMQTVLAVLSLDILPRLRLSITFCSLSFLSVSFLEERASPSSGQSRRHCPDPGRVAISPLPHLVTSNDPDLHKFTISLLNGRRGTKIVGEVTKQSSPLQVVKYLC